MNLSLFIALFILSINFCYIIAILFDLGFKIYEKHLKSKEAKEYYNIYRQYIIKGEKF